jgi:peptide/nickel transport system substrate-binding protein
LFDTPTSESPSGPLETEAFASIATKAAGIGVTIKTKTFDYLYSNFNDGDPSAVKNANQWGIDNDGGLGTDYYPTSEGSFNTGSALNAGGYSDPTADRLMRNSVYGSDPNAVKIEASYLTKQVPILFMPNVDYVFAVSKRVGGSTDSFLALTQLVTFPQFWYINKT